MNVHNNLIYVSQKVKTTKCSSTDEYMNKMCYTYKMEYYWAIKRNEVLMYAIWMNLKKYAKWKNPDTKGHMLYHSIYTK